MMGDVMGDCPQRTIRLRLDGEQLARRLVPVGMFVGKLEVRQFPITRVDSVGRTLPGQKASLALDPKNDAMPDLGGGLPSSVWQLFHDAALPRDAEFSDRATVALWIARLADDRTKFHQGLIQCRAGRPSAFGLSVPDRSMSRSR